MASVGGKILGGPNVRTFLILYASQNNIKRIKTKDYLNILL